ncbi:esterase family protein [bacterium]|nr:MAG: esterase family protein [bacterium]
MPLARLQFFSQALGKQTAVTLILPAASIEPPYTPWLLLHGLSDDETIWTRRTSLERYVDGLPFVVAMPDGGRGFYVDAPDGYAYYTALSEELPAMLERYLPLRKEWAVGGLSMGGYGALRIALGRPDRFRSAHSHSGALGFGQNPRYRETTEFDRLVGEGETNSLYALGRSASPKPAIRIDCGVDDFLLEDNRAYTTFLKEIGYDHEYEEFPGAHDWAYWDEHVQEQMAFHRKNLGV